MSYLRKKSLEVQLLGHELFVKGQISIREAFGSQYVRRKRRKKMQLIPAKQPLQLPASLPRALRFGSPSHPLLLLLTGRQNTVLSDVSICLRGLTVSPLLLQEPWVAAAARFAPPPCVYQAGHALQEICGNMAVTWLRGSNVPACWLNACNCAVFL